MSPLSYRFGQGVGTEGAGGTDDGRNRIRSGRCALRIDHPGKKRVPVLEVAVAVENIDGGEEPLAARDALEGRPPHRTDELVDGMEREGEKVHRKQQVGETRLAVPEVVLGVITVVFQHVERFVLDLPAASRTLCEPLHIGRFDLDRGDEGTAVGDLSVFFSLDLERQPVDLQGIPVGGERHAVHPPVAVGVVVSVDLPGLFQFLKLKTVKIVIKRLMGGLLGGEDEVTAGFHDLPAHGLSGEKIVTEIDRMKMAAFLMIVFKPSLGGLRLAVLLVMAVLRNDELRGQVDHPVAAGLYDGGTKRIVMVVRHFLFDFCGAEIAVNPVGMVELRSVQCDEDVLSELQILPKLLIVCDFIERRVECRIEPFRIDAVKLLADVVVRRDAPHAVERLAGALVVRFLELSLMIEKRRRLREEHREGGHRDVLEPVLRVRSPARIGKCPEDAAQLAKQPVDHELHGIKFISDRGSLYKCHIFKHLRSIS